MPKLNKLYYVHIYLFESNTFARCVITAASQAEAESAAVRWADPIGKDGGRVTSSRYLCDTVSSVFEEL